MTETQFFQDHHPGTPFEVQVEGAGVESFLKPIRCGYFEWSYGQKAEGEWVRFSVAYQSPEPLVLSVQGGKVELPVQRIRAFLAPGYERDYPPGDVAAPELVGEEAAARGTPISAAEYCLETGRTYWAVVNEVSIALPPEEPGQAPRMEVRRVLHIGDEMKAGAFVHPMTPAFRGFSF